LKAGGELRVGAFGFGFAQSSITKLYDRVDAPAALQQEASVTVDLPRLLPVAQGSSVSKLIPTLWLTGSDRQTPGAFGTLSTSVGGSWTFDFGYASFGAWTYSSDGSDKFQTSWSGHGFDANLGAYYAAVAVDVSLSYGQSSDVAPYWQSAGGLYNSSLTLSYTPAKLPGLSATAAAGNYDQNAISFGSTASEMYGVSTGGEYWSLGGGLDLTNWVWTPEQAEQADGQRPSVKLLYRYTDALYLDSSGGTTRDVNHLWAMIIQRKF
jgi:hypothetical protein